MARTRSSDAWLREHFQDSYVKRAQREGYRSRAAYKLLEIDRRDRLFKPGLIVVDLGAAPGGWTQYAAKQVGPRGRVVAVDLLPISPLAGVEIVQGDFTEQSVLNLVNQAVRGAPIDLVISDMAPNISGIMVSDQARAIALAESALEFAHEGLRPGGRLLVKTFQGEGFAQLFKRMQAYFGRVTSRKPQASRARSREIYLVGFDKKA